MVRFTDLGSASYMKRHVPEPYSIGYLILLGQCRKDVLLSFKKLQFLRATENGLRDIVGPFLSVDESHIERTDLGSK